MIFCLRLSTLTARGLQTVLRHLRMPSLSLGPPDPPQMRQLGWISYAAQGHASHTMSLVHAKNSVLISLNYVPV